MLDRIRRIRLQRRIDAERAREELAVVSQYPEGAAVPLTEDERRQVAALWGQLTPVTSWKEYGLFKRMYGFDARFLSHHIYLPVVARLLNDYDYTRMFDDKGLLGYLAKSSLNFPYTVVRRVSGDYYSARMRQITREEAVAACAAEESLFLKPSNHVSGGHGSESVSLVGLSPDARERRVEKAFAAQGRDFVAQRAVRQHPVMAQFNPDSVNSLRVTTLLLNGRYSLCSILLRMGRAGSSVDNWGVGGLLAHVDEDGTIAPKAYDIALKEYESNGGCVFAGKTIPQMPKILEAVEKAHTEEFALCKLVGWDVTLDESGEPVILELNSSQPGLIAEQMFTGPIFGDRTQEVIDYCKTKTFKY